MLSKSIRRFIGSIALGCSLIPAATGAVRAQESQVSEEAKQHFRAGVSLLQDPDGARYEEAYREFKAAYDASHASKILGNVAFCAMKMERDGEAIDAYTRYLAETTDIDPEERKQITRDLATMRSGLVRVVITVDPADATIMDSRVPVRGDSVNNVYVPSEGRIEMGIRHGHHTFRARNKIGESTPWEFDATPGGTFTHHFIIRKTPDKQQVVVQTVTTRSRVAPWIVTGAGVAMLAGAGVTGYLTMSKLKDIDKNCPANQCRADFNLSSERTSTKTFATVTDVLLVGGGLATAGGITWLLLTPSSSTEATPAPQSPPPAAKLDAPGFACVSTGCFAEVHGQF